MKIAYLMLVHRNPCLLKRAIGILSSRDCAFFIHVDLKTDIREFSEIGGENVFFSRHRIPVYWGEFSQVEATMGLVQQSLACSERYEYLSFSTGSDYPLRSGAHIRRFLERNRGWEFMSLTRVPAPGYPLSKINKLRYPSDDPVRRFVTRGLAKLGLAHRDYRKYLGGLDAYAGHGSWTLSREACSYAVNFAARNPSIERYFRRTFTPDEMFLHTILGNSPFRDRVRKSLTYIDWRIPGDHPSILSNEHLSLFEAQEKVWIEDEWGAGEVLFARKFSDENLGLVDRIDEIIRQKEETSAHSQALIPNSADSQRAV